MHLNDNLYKNIDRFSVNLYDGRFEKAEISIDEKTAFVEEYVKVDNEKDQEKVLHKALDKILIAHRNTKLFLFMMTGPFFLLAKTVQYIIKGIVFYWFYKKAKTVAPGNGVEEKPKEDQDKDYPPKEPRKTVYLNAAKSEDTPNKE